MSSENDLYCVVPLTPTEAAVAAAIWDQQGVLGRLVRIDDPLTRGILRATAEMRPWGIDRSVPAAAQS